MGKKVVSLLHRVLPEIMWSQIYRQVAWQLKDVRFLADHQFSSLSLLLPLTGSGCLSMLLSVFTNIKPIRDEWSKAIEAWVPKKSGVLLSWICSILVPPSRGQCKIATATADIASNPSNLALFFPSQPRLKDSEMPFTASCLLIKFLEWSRLQATLENDGFYM